MKVTIVIPTYNEVENIKRLVPVLFEEFAKYPNYEWSALFVDGNSPDGSSQEIQKFSATDSRIHLLLEPEKRGLGSAYLSGFREAIDNLKADIIVEMDADFQHDPKDVIRLVREIDNGYDYVIGSRFVAGGSIPKEWAFYRKFLSFGGSLFSKVVLGIYSINDFTSGFKCSRVAGFLDKVDFTQVISKGFAYKINLLYKMHLLGAKFKEIPIEFGLRDRGDSKMENNNFSDSLKVVLLLRFKQSKSFFKFVIVGFSGLFVDLLIFNVLRILTSNSVASALISGAIAMFTTFMLNNYWSFGERKIESISKQVIGIVVYVASSSVPILVRSKLVHYSTDTFGDTFIVSNISFFIGIVFGLIWNYTVYSRIIWKKK